MVEMSLRCKQTSPGREKNLLGQLSPFGTSCSLSFKSALSVISLTVVKDRDRKVYSGTDSCCQGEIKGTAVSGMARWVIQGTSIVFFISIRGLWSLMDSRQEETNLTSKVKMQGPSKRIMATIGSRKGRNHVLEGSQDFIWFHTCVEA
jgi:hypothetical protein